MTDTPPGPPNAGGSPSAPPGSTTAPPDPAPAESSDGATPIPRWLIGVVGVVLVAAVVVVLLVVLGGGDDGDGTNGDGEVLGALPDRVDDSTASSPRITLATDTLWDLDEGVFTTQVGNTCSYRRPDSLVGCTLIGGDPGRRVELDGADISVSTSIGPADGAQLLGPRDVPGCPSSVSIPSGDAPLAETPALCVMSSEDVPFAVYVTGVSEDGSTTARAAEVVR